MKCSKCGAELSEDSKFCSYCGNKIETAPSQKSKVMSDTPSISLCETVKAPNKNTEGPKSLAVKMKEKVSAQWSKLSTYGKVATVAITVFAMLFMVAILAGKTAAAVIAVIQIALAVVAVFMHRGIIKLEQKQLWLKWLVLAFAVLLVILNVMSYSWGSKTPTPTSNINQKQEIQTPSVVDNNSGEQQTDHTSAAEKEPLSIMKGTEYAYMTDEWNVYIATAISDDIIKIENWNKTMSNSKSVSYEYDVGTFKINDGENSFAWVDDEHTAFLFTFVDKKNGDFKKGGTATFTINISDSDKNKGSDYSDEIACYSYQNDDWHLYRAIPLTDTLIKIETWYRGSSIESFLFGYDLCLIDTTSGDTDFEWTDNERTSFTITMRDEKNKYEWKNDAFVVYTLENEDYSYFDVKSFLGKWEVGEGEVAVPASASDYKYDNYQDVQKDLENAGFTNITTSILYDIVFGWTDEGEVKSVSIDGRTDYEKGEVFKQDAPIVITYHMKEEDDPNKNSKAEASNSDSMEQQEEESHPVFYSTNDYETAKQGNTGVFSYKSAGTSYDVYWIIDFDEGYVYWFSEGNGDSTCDRLRIDSGTLNDRVIITYHDGGDEWSYNLHFNFVNHPETLVLIDNDGFDYSYSATDLYEALSLRDSKTIMDY